MNLRSRGSGPRALNLARPSPGGTLARTRTSMDPINNRSPTCSATRVGVVPEGRTRTSDHLGVNQQSFPAPRAVDPGKDTREWCWSTVSSRRRARLQRAALPSELLQPGRCLDPTPRIERGHWRFCRPPPSHLARSGSEWHQGKDLNPHLVVQSHGSYPLDDPGVAPSTGIEPASSCSTDSRPHQRASRAKEKEPWWWCAGEDLRLHSTKCPSRRVNTTTAVVWLAMPIRFSRCWARILRAKEKGPGVARPFVEILL